MPGVLDIFNPQISVVSYDMAGKTILVYGSNRTGKTKQACRFPKPYYLAFEKGINAIAGIPFAPIQKWSDFVKINKQLTNPKTLDKAKELYQTIIFDQVYASALMCQDFVCEMYGVNSIKEGNNGYGLWTEYEKEYWSQINRLTGAGYTIIFIAHDGSRKFKDEQGEEYEKIYPEGDKRSIDPICDLVDIILFLQQNGLDENGNEIKSSGYMVNTKDYHAGSRFDYLQPVLPEFSAENLQKAVADAVKKQEEVEGKPAVDYNRFKDVYETKTYTFEELQDYIKKYAMALNDANRFDEYTEIVEQYLGKGGKASQATPKQLQILERIYDDLKDIEIDLK